MTNKRTETHGDVIYRADAINKFEPWLKVEGYNEGELNMLKAVLYELRFLPSAEPEIIRCQYCKHNTSKPNAGNASCELFYGMSDQYGFCHRAERREDKDLDIS